MTMNLADISIHKDSPRVVNAVIEIEKHSSIKYEYDKELGVFRYDRGLDSAMVYPANYGFIPGTYCDDGDALDILVIAERPIDKGTLIEVRPLGVLDMNDDGFKDYKVLAVPVPTKRRFRNLDDVDPMFLRICRNFFSHYKDLEGKKVVVGKWLNKQRAFDIIKKS